MEQKEELVRNGLKERIEGKKNSKKKTEKLLNNARQGNETRKMEILTNRITKIEKDIQTLQNQLEYIR